MVRERLIDEIRACERWLIQRVLGYARSQDYAKYTSTLEEAWRMSIAGLSSSLAIAVRSWEAPRETGPDEDYERDPAAAFGVLEAQRHRERGVDFPMFLGLMKYYRRSYLDLCAALGWPRADAELARTYVERFFDRMELGFCAEWVKQPGEEQLSALRDTNRRMTNEKNKYLTLFESAAVPMLLFDAQDRPSALNHAAARLLEGAVLPGAGYYGGDRQSLGLPWLQGEVSRFARSRAAEAASEQEVQTPDGPRRYDVRLKAMLDVSGKFDGTTVVLFDLTDLRRAERLEQELLQAQKLEAVGRLAAGIAHQINNPLACVLSNLGSLCHEVAALPPTPEREEARHAAADALLGAGRVRDIVRDLNVFVSDGAPDAPTDLAKVLRLSVNLARWQVERRARLVLHLPALPAVLGSESRLGQVFVNLLSNAAHAIPPGCAGENEVEVRAWAAAGRVLVAVRDTGVGIAAEVRARLFEPFFTTRPAGTAKGLGLTVCHAIVTSLGGDIAVESEMGKGSTFRVSLPTASV